jgi:hypothetical protein
MGWQGALAAPRVRVVWMGDRNRIAMTGFSHTSDRQVAVWETGVLKNIKTLALDQSVGVVDALLERQRPLPQSRLVHFAF